MLLGSSLLLSIRKNDAAMKIGHLEILAALTLLCKPDPLNGVVEYEPVRHQLIDMYGPAVDHRI